MGGWRRAEVVACGSRSLCTAACSPFLMPRARRWTGKESREERSQGGKAGWRRVEEGTGGDRCSSSLSVLCEAREAINRVFRGFGKPTGKPTLAQTWPRYPFASSDFLEPCVPPAYPLRTPTCLTLVAARHDLVPRQVPGRDKSRCEEEKTR